MFTFKNITKNITILTLVAGLSLASLASIIPAQAAGVAVTLTPTTRAVATTGSVSVIFTNTVALPVGSKINVLYPNTYTGTPSTANVTINAVAPSAVVSSASGSNTLVTLTTAALIPVSTAITTVFSLTTPNVIGNYSFAVYTDTDYGSALQYIGDANAVNVSAFVPPNLSFVIRNNTDTADTNTCNMGTLSTASNANCDYRLKIGTNSTSGYVVSVQTTGDFTGGGNIFANAAVGATGSSVTAGTEIYGVNVTAGSITGTGSGITLPTAYGTTAGNIVRYNNTTSNVLATAIASNAPATSGDTTNTILVNHRAAIGANTRAGTYTQKVTYTVVANF